MKKALYWHKKDFRLFDNEVVNFAAENNFQLLPFYCWEPKFLDSYEAAPFHQYAAAQGIDSVSAHYQKYDLSFLEAYGDFPDVLDEIKMHYNFDILLAYQEHGGRYTFARDLVVHQWCKQNNIEFIELQPYSVVRKLKTRDDREKHWKGYVNGLVRGIPKNLIALKPAVSINSFDKKFLLKVKKVRAKIAKYAKAGEFEKNLQKISEKTAHLVLEDFLNNRSLYYRGSISSPNSAFTHGSRLSVHLAWGTISLRYLYQKALAKHAELEKLKELPQASEISVRHARSLTAFMARLHWRDHFIQRIEDFPEIEWLEINNAFTNLPYELDKHLYNARLAAWLAGKTGEPLVDACMRCLGKTGFVNFRMRAMCVSYAMFALHLNWKDIGFGLAPLFYDYEPGIHWSQVQMQAGIMGINSIRVYSPEKQLKDQDPNCIFVKKWIPELSNFSADEIQNYKLQTLGNYPKPVVDFKTSSKKMKDAVFAIKKSDANKVQSAYVIDKFGSRVFGNSHRFNSKYLKSR